jgi:superfamily I DNA and/or RNA helicase
MTEGLGQNVTHDLLIVDEASTATDLDILVPWIVGDQKNKAQSSLLLVGDHEQLPPTILTQSIAKEKNFAARILGDSLSKRLIDVQ